MVVFQKLKRWRGEKALFLGDPSGSRTLVTDVRETKRLGSMV
jgi:hypothetical protein